MIKMLATTPDASEIGVWVQVAVMILGGVALVFGIVEFFATKREVKALETRVTSLEVALTNLGTKLDKTKDDVLNAGSVRASNLHLRCDQILSTQSEMKGQLNSVTALLGELVKKEIHK